MADLRQSAVCPWCWRSTTLTPDGRLASHWHTLLTDHECPAVGSTPEDAQDKADEALTYHAATGDDLDVWGH